jgi:hypothetical protein
MCKKPIKHKEGIFMKKINIITPVMLFALLLLTGCAAPMHVYTYVPSQQSAEKIQPTEAKKIITARFSDCWYSGSELEITSIKILDDRINIVTRSGAHITYRFYDMGTIQSKVYDEFDAPNFYSIGGHAKNQNVDYYFPTCSRGNWSVEGSHRLADALLSLKLGYDTRAHEYEEKFRQTAANYRNATQKPALPEDVRKYKIQAEFAVRQKRFDDAADRYDQALQIASWWPQGHFNRALILGELKRYGEAIDEMNRYLLLVPDAQNVRAAKDKIYQWDDARKIKSASK